MNVNLKSSLPYKFMHISIDLIKIDSVISSVVNYKIFIEKVFLVIYPLVVSRK